MKFSLLLLLLLPMTALAQIDGLRVEGNVIIWENTGGWMEVQDSVRFDPVEGCVGFITSCRVPNGLYQVVDHTSSQRQERIRVPNESDNPSPINRRAGCGFGVGTSSPLRCDATCPESSDLLAVVGCIAFWGVGADREIVPVFSQPVDFNGDDVWDGAWCEAITDQSRLSSEFMTMETTINCTR